MSSPQHLGNQVTIQLLQAQEAAHDAVVEASLHLAAAGWSTSRTASIGSAVQDLAQEAMAKALREYVAVTNAVRLAIEEDDDPAILVKPEDGERIANLRAQVDLIEAQRARLPKDERRRLDAADAPLLRTQLLYFLEAQCRNGAELARLREASGQDEPDDRRP